MVRKSMRSLFNSRNLFTVKLSGSTVLETIVASVIFMIVFTMGMDILTRILTFNSKDNENLLIESAFNKCEREIERKGLSIGNEIYTFDWGEIQVTVSQYRNNLFEVEMNAKTHENKRVIYRYIATNESNQE